MKIDKFIEPTEPPEETHSDTLSFGQIVPPENPDLMKPLLCASNKIMIRGRCRKMYKHLNY